MSDDEVVDAETIDDEASEVVTHDENTQPWGVYVIKKGETQARLIEILMTPLSPIHGGMQAVLSWTITDDIEPGDRVCFAIETASLVVHTTLSTPSPDHAAQVVEEALAERHTITTDELDRIMGKTSGWASSVEDLTDSGPWR